MKQVIFIFKIFQVDNHTFSIQWSDGTIQSYRLSELQKQCPCAQCRDEITGEQRITNFRVQEDVRAHYIRSVGRYGLRIQFTTGCSTGIYSFDYLKNMEPKTKGL